jgi:hypothetical protein
MKVTLLAAIEARLSPQSVALHWPSAGRRRGLRATVAVIQCDAECGEHGKGRLLIRFTLAAIPIRSQEAKTGLSLDEKSFELRPRLADCWQCGKGFGPYPARVTIGI